MEKLTARNYFQTAFNAAGFILTLVSIYFVFALIHRYAKDVSTELLRPSIIVVVITCSILYGVLLLLIGSAWYFMILSVDGKDTDLKTIMSIYAKTQVYKYIPSNVLHFVGRYAMARKHNVTHQALAFSQITEIVLICASALVTSMLLSRELLLEKLRDHGIDVDPMVPIFLDSVACIALLTLILAALRGSAHLTAKRILPAVAASIVCYLLFFAGNGLLIYCLSLFLAAPVTINPTSMIGVAAAAWLVGFVVPGAPGGIGLRDAVLISGISSLGLNPETSISLALSHRIVTIVGDCILACCSYLFVRMTGRIPR